REGRAVESTLTDPVSHEGAPSNHMSTREFAPELVARGAPPTTQPIATERTPTPGIGGTSPMDPGVVEAALAADQRDSVSRTMPMPGGAAAALAGARAAGGAADGVARRPSLDRAPKRK